MRLIIEQIDPDTSEARWCLDHYFAELGERFEGGFKMPTRRLAPSHRPLDARQVGERRVLARGNAYRPVQLERLDGIARAS